MWPQEAELLFGPYTSLCMEDAGDMEKKGLKRFIKLRVSISTNRPSLEGLDLDDCTAVPLWVSSMNQFEAHHVYASTIRPILSPPAPAGLLSLGCLAAHCCCWSFVAIQISRYLLFIIVQEIIISVLTER
jgi:hypothetical protein